MKIGITNDHRGLKLKLELIPLLEEKGYGIIDLGSNTTERVDYPLLGFELGERLVKKEFDYAIGICGSAIGMCVALNKVKGVRCGIADTVYEAEHGKRNDQINALSLRGEHIDAKDSLGLIEAMINTEHSSDPRYSERVVQIERYENANNGN